MRDVFMTFFVMFILRFFSVFNPILPWLLNTRQTRGGGHILPPPNSLLFYPRNIKFGL